jgi:hypothetical protein
MKNTEQLLNQSTNRSLDDPQDYFRHVRSEIAKQAMSERVQAGECPGIAPLGYLNVVVGDKRTVAIDETVAPCIVEAFRMAAGQLIPSEDHRRARTEGARQEEWAAFGYLLAPSSTEESILCRHDSTPGQALPGNPPTAHQPYSLWPSEPIALPEALSPMTRNVRPTVTPREALLQLA